MEVPLQQLLTIIINITINAEWTLLVKTSVTNNSFVP